MSMRAGLSIGIAAVVIHSATSAEAITPQHNTLLESRDLMSGLPLPADRIWVNVRSSISIEELADKLNQDETKLVKLNDFTDDYIFQTGDWLVLPSSATNKGKQLVAFDTRKFRYTQPLAPPLEAQEPAHIRLEDSLAKIASRYKFSITELLSLNPGLQASRLVAGNQIRVDKTTSGGATPMIQGLNPHPSGGLSWPEKADFLIANDHGTKTSRTVWIWPTTGIYTTGYGWRSGTFHQGIHISNKAGTPIVAARWGKVVFAGRKYVADQPDCFNSSLVEIRHADGTLSRYSSNGEIIARLGQYVDQGTIISNMGEDSIGCSIHLHFEILPVGSGPVNPLQFLPSRRQKETAAQPNRPLPPLPTKRKLVRSSDGSTFRPLHSGAFQQACRTGVLSSHECRPDMGAIQRACRIGALSPQECRYHILLQRRWGGRRRLVPRAAWPAQPDLGPISKPLSTREQSLLNQIRNRPVINWRRYGKCQYDWGGWKLHANGTRTTAADCGGAAMRWQVAVSCKRLLVATLSKDGKWSSWKRPAGPESNVREGEDEMVAALCANASK